MLLKTPIIIELYLVCDIKFNFRILISIQYIMTEYKFYESGNNRCGENSPKTIKLTNLWKQLVST